MGTKRLRRGPRNTAAGPLKPHVDSFTLTLRAAGRSERTDHATETRAGRPVAEVTAAVVPWPEPERPAGHRTVWSTKDP
ncbi:hypothetical protein [Nocardiopsis sp. FIRDI 009]|uniref:hypothetical protein n=1 Tax=Nocardiopsis sp. FIRDI 009 TaxID=714197 RepID=UPI000E23F00F|nr:hypothetical protein [Nocardiopsis sp. FIRDI 009]